MTRPRLNWNSLGRNSPLVDLKSLGSSPLPPPTSLQVLPEFLSPSIGDSLLKLSNIKLRRLAGRAYQQKHFDSVIHGYREGLVSDWTPFPRLSSPQSIAPDEETLPRRLFETLIRDLDLHNQGHSWLAPHILDLENGSSGIGAHTDHPTALGSLIMGICLGSLCVMVYRRVGKPDEFFTVLLPPNCAYIMRDSVRYDFTHEIPTVDSGEHVFRGSPIARDRRVVLLLRNRFKGRPDGQRAAGVNYNVPKKE